MKSRREAQSRRRRKENRKAGMTKLQRTTFEASRAAEYFDARQLSALTGVPREEFLGVCLKELADNALDACETAGVAPEVSVAVEYHEDGLCRLSVSDNGPGIPSELIEKVLDYNVRVSDKMAYRSPTRGAQGNALKTIIGIPYSLGSHEPLVITARGVRHTIRPWVDPSGYVRVSHAKAEENGTSSAGTRLELAVSAEEVKKLQDFDPHHWVRSFAAFNPHATLSYQAKIDSHEGTIIYKSTHEGPFKKYVPSEPTSPHWYSPESLKVLVFSHIAHARNGGRDLPLGEFVRQFAGLTSTKKAKAVCSQLPGFTHLSDFEEDEDAVAELLARMQDSSKPPKASALGHVGEEHFQAFFDHVYEVNEFKYVRRSGTLPSGLPFTFEFALATLDEPGHLYCGINFSPAFGDPLAGTTLAGPEFRADGIRGFLSDAYALPENDDIWYSTPASVAVAAHIITPAPIFFDRGKTRLNMEGA
jgi:DNA topoisomerase VI subunit B